MERTMVNELVKMLANLNVMIPMIQDAREAAFDKKEALLGEQLTDELVEALQMREEIEHKLGLDF